MSLLPDSTRYKPIPSFIMKTALYIVIISCIYNFSNCQSIGKSADAKHLFVRIPNANRISQQKCIEYADIIQRQSRFSLSRSRRSVQYLQPHKINQKNIVGGKKAVAKEFAHMALIGFNSGSSIKWNCGGSLISESFVMTAAHCLYSPEYGPAKHVRLGDLVLHSVLDIAQPVDLKISSTIVHPKYNPPSQYNDIALIKLAKSVVFSPFIYPACLHDQKQIHATLAIATGWGLTEFAGSTSNHLMKVELELFKFAKCNRTYKLNRKLKTGIDDASQLCAGSTTAEKDTCQGDSGGPLQVYRPLHDFMYNIIGVTSFGKGCGMINVPAVYTRVSHYLDWIEPIVWK